MPSRLRFDHLNKPPEMKGAGDLVAKAAHPIAKFLDGLIGTDLLNCGGCKERQEKLNEKFPFKKD